MKVGAGSGGVRVRSGVSEQGSGGALVGRVSRVYSGIVDQVGSHISG